MKRVPNVIKSFGSSMSPLLLDEDIVYLKKIALSRIKVDDIICVRKNRKVFTHRVIYKAKNYLITKGDANTLSDGKVYPRQIIGKVEKVKRDGEIFDIESLYLLQSTLYFQEIVKVKKALEREKIDFLFLKGLPLHLYFEKTHPRRMYADCDILVAKESFPKLETVLKKYGYSRKALFFSKALETLKNKRKQSQVTFLKIFRGFTVAFDVHLDIFFMTSQLESLEMLYPYADKLTRSFLTEKEAVQVLNENFPILSQTNLFIFLCLHLFHHNFKGGYRYNFINRVIQNKTFNYAETRNKILDYELQNFVYPSVVFLSKYYKSCIPNSFLDSIEPHDKASYYIENNILRINVFNDDGVIEERVNRFRSLFFLSPQPLHKKIMVFFNAQVLYAVWWVLRKRSLTKIIQWTTFR